MQPTPLLKDLILLGGGHSHVAVLRHFGMRPLPGLRLTLVTRDVHTPYSGMLPGFIAGHYSYDDCHIDLDRLARFAGATLIHAEAEGLDPEQRRLYLPGRPPLRYDILSINTGSRPPVLDTPGSAEHAIPVKPIDRFLECWQQLLERFHRHRGPFRLLVAGAGAGGVELLLAVQHRLRWEQQQHSLVDVELGCHLVSATPFILPGHNARVRARFERLLLQRGVEVHKAVAVERVERDRVALSDGLKLPVEAVFWVTGASTPTWLAESGLATDEAGFVSLEPSLRSVSHPEVFAAGDVAHVEAYPRPKSGVFAVRQGPPLAINLRRAVLGKTPRPFRPQRRFLSLISTGDRYAVASRGGWALSGSWVWRWKDRIDRAFMHRFGELPAMRGNAPEIPAGLTDPATLTRLMARSMRCGGCGAKLGGKSLREVLADLNIEPREDIAIGVHDADDAAVFRVPDGQSLVQSVDHFRTFVDDPHLFGRIAANHALGDLFAMGATPHSALAIATLPYASPGIQADLLRQLMAGALEVLRAHDTALIGGHSGEGLEMALGFTVNGLGNSLLTKAGLQSGDGLILTKPLGTGTLLAAAMQGRARGYWLEQAYATMCQSSKSAADILRAHGASACTDVTGFGLLGHLLEMLQAGSAGTARPAAELDLAALPVLGGALETIAQGITSTLADANRDNATALDRALETEPRYQLLFDPQTAGGLLAGVPESQLAGCIRELRAAGYPDATRIGRVVDREATARPRSGASESEFRQTGQPLVFLQ